MPGTSTQPGVTSTVRAPEWPLVGRDDEFAVAREAIAAHGGVVLTGGAGVGKTRLARELLAVTAASGGRTEWIAATEAAAHVPLGAAAHLIPGKAVGHGRDATLRAIVGALANENARGPLVVGVDDAHLLDDVSAALVHLLATTRTASVVVTVRSGRPPPDSIVALWKDGPAPLIALQALSRQEVESLVTSVLDGPIEGSVLHQLWKLSGGNALFLREFVRHGIESGDLRRERGLWRWPGRFEPGDRLQDIVAVRIGALDDEERSALELVAVGEPLTFECVRALGVSGSAERLERRGVLTSRGVAVREVTLAHPLFGEFVRAGMPSTRLDEVRLLLADAFEATAVIKDPAGRFRVALWRADAGDRSHVDELRAAAWRARSLWAPAVAERLARAALESGPDLEAGYVLGEALSDQSKPGDALDAWRAVEDLPGPDRIQALRAGAQASILNFHFDRVDEARAVLRRAAGRIREEDARHIIDDALSLIDATNPVPPSEGPSELSPISPPAVLAAALAATAAGQLDRATQLADDAIRTVDSWSEEFPTTALLLLMTKTWARALGGHVREAEAEAEQQYAAAVAEHAEYPRFTWCLLRGQVALLRGLPHRATSVLREGIALAGYEGWQRPMHAYLAMAAALSGDARAAEDHELQAAAANRSIDGIFAVDVRRARAWVRAARGELTAAVEEARQAAVHAAAANQAALEALALHDLARWGRASEVCDRLAELARVVDGGLVDMLAAHARALANDDGAALDAVAATSAALGLDLLAAEASAAAAGAHRRVGRKTRAFAARDRSRQLAAGCEGARTLALVWADRPDDLTAREREVAALAGSNLTSRAIAERLDITTRTVDNLLGRVYTKLAISSRRELVELFSHSRE